MAAGAGIDLHRRGAGGANPFGVIERRLSTFDDADVQRVAGRADGALEQAGLARPRGADQVQRQDTATGQPAAVAFGQQMVLGQQVLFEPDRTTVQLRMLARCVVACGSRVMIMVMVTVTVMGMPFAIAMLVRRAGRRLVAGRWLVLDDCAGIGTTAGYAHHTTSSSLISNRSLSGYSISSCAPLLGVPLAQISK